MFRAIVKRPMTRLVLGGAMTAVTAGAASESSAGLIAYEGFAAGSSSGFAASMDSGNSTGLIYGSLVTTGADANEARAGGSGGGLLASVQTPGAGSIWISFLTQRTADINFSRLQLSEGGSEKYHLASDRAGDTLWLAARSGSGSAGNADTGVPFALSTTFLVVAQVQSGSVTMWINPGNLGGANPTGGTSVVRSGLTDAEFDTLTLVADAPTHVFDEIRVGTTYADVTPIPEPASATVLGLAGLALMRRRRSHGA